MNKKIINFLTKISSHTGIKIYSENIFFLSLEKIIRILGGFFVGIYVARALTPKYYGLFNYVISYVTIFTLFSLSFLNNIAIREMARDEQNCGQVLGTLRFLKYMGSLVMLLLIFASTYIIPMDNSTRPLIWIFGIGAFFAGADYFSPYFIFKRQNKIIALSSLIIFLIISVFRIYFAWRKFPLIDFIILEAIFLIGLFVVLRTIFYRQINFKLQNSQLEQTRYIQAGKMLFFTTLFYVITIKSELLILKEFTTEQELGIYSVAMKIIEAFTFLTAAFGNTFFPSIANSKNSSESLYQHRLKLYFGIIFYINLICTLAIIILAPFFAMLYGSSYQGVTILIILYALRLPLWGIGTPLNQHLYIENRIKYLTLFSFVSMFFTIAFTIIFTKYFGLKGAAICGLPVQLISLFVLPICCKRQNLAGIIIESLWYFPKEMYKKLKKL